MARGVVEIDDGEAAQRLGESDHLVVVDLGQRTEESRPFAVLVDLDLGGRIPVGVNHRVGNADEVAGQLEVVDPAQNAAEWFPPAKRLVQTLVGGVQRDVQLSQARLDQPQRDLRGDQ